MRIQEGKMASNLFKVAFAVLVLGWSPLLFYTVFGSADDDPIGLGILAGGAIILSLILASVSGTIYLLRSWREDRLGAQARPHRSQTAL
jgi:hypothetical protein